ncbi:MAG TPA: HD-GYP domain-containing protein [Burkholderiales bacterium]|nr:HD-GYP domain-containing protein [Burkholderiales bacterium]
MRKIVSVSELQFGMYVAELDRPWTDTPFMFQGFVLENAEQLEILKKFCKSVTVDYERSALPDPLPLKPMSVRHSTQVPVEREVEKAKVAHVGTQAAVREVLAAVRANKMLDAKSVEQAVGSMTESVLRNPDALVLFSQLREKGDYTQSHAIDVAVYMTSFGRFLQLPVEQISLLGYLGLMQDIGKLRVPNEIIAKRDRLSALEFEQAKKHVGHSVEILRTAHGLPPQLPELAALHHERRDGSGYPKGLKGNDIGMLGSIAAIVDTFDALTTRRPYAEAVSPSTALSMLYKWRGTFFDAGLVEQFIRCIGIFPLGSVVELNSGEIGIVIAQNTEKRLQPRVMVIRDAHGNPLRPQKLLDLSRSPKVSADEVYRIKRTLEYGKAAVSAESLFMT